MVETRQEYLDLAPEVGRAWLQEFWEHVESRCPGIEMTMFRQVPMYKFGKSYLDGYLMFTTAKGHFSAHSVEFDLIADTKPAIPGAFGGKGCVSVKYTNTDAKPALKAYVDDVLRRHGKLT